MNIVIMDSSAVRMNAKMVLEEGLFLVDPEKDQWCASYQYAKSFPSPNEAVEVAKKIAPTLAKMPRVFSIQQNGPSINITEYKY